MSLFHYIHRMDEIFYNAIKHLRLFQVNGMARAWNDMQASMWQRLCHRTSDGRELAIKLSGN